MKVSRTPFVSWFLVLPVMGIHSLYAQNNDAVPDVPEAIREIPPSFKDGYQGAAYDYVERTSWWERVQRWFIDFLVDLFDLRGQQASNVLGILEIVFYTLVIIGVAYLIVRIVLNKEIRWIFKRKKEHIKTLSYDIAGNIQEVDFKGLIQSAKEKGDFRSAIRYHYLWVLKKLDAYGVIQFDGQKTTFDYQLEVEDSKYAQSFGKATYYYTYIWYGSFAIDEEEYRATSSVYKELIDTLSK